MEAVTAVSCNTVHAVGRLEMPKRPRSGLEFKPAVKNAVNDSIERLQDTVNSVGLVTLQVLQGGFRVA
jgi:hypothetical protein